jgi:hypothetical protein
MVGWMERGDNNRQKECCMLWTTAMNRWTCRHDDRPRREYSHMNAWCDMFIISFLAMMNLSETLLRSKGGGEGPGFRRWKDEAKGWVRPTITRTTCFQKHVAMMIDRAEDILARLHDAIYIHHIVERWRRAELSSIEDEANDWVGQRFQGLLDFRTRRRRIL